MKYTTTINLLNYVNAWSETFYIARLMYNSMFAHCWCLCLASINICSLLTLSCYMVMKLCLYQKFIFSLEIVIILVILITFSLLLGAMRLLDTGKYSLSDCSEQSGVFLPFKIFSCWSADILRSNWWGLGFQSSNLHQAYFTSIYMLVNWRYGLKFSVLFPCNPVLDLY